jgi:hypothetical protein
MYSALIFNVPDVQNPFIKMIDFSHKIDTKRFSGWIRTDADTIVGMVVCLNRNKNMALSLINQHFKDNAPVKIVNEKNVCHPKLFVGNFLVLNSIDKTRIWWQKSTLVIDQINHNGLVMGWYFDPNEQFVDQVISVFIDNTFIGITKSNNFRKDLLLAGVGTGDHAFEIIAPQMYLDGEQHSVVCVAGNSKIRMEKTIKFPTHFKVEASWRQSKDLPKIHQIRSDIVNNGINQNIDDLIGIIDKKPELVFIDFGIEENYRRANKHFLSFRERLSARLQSTHCPDLIHKFNSKEFTKQFCLDNDIRTPNTLLIANNFDDIKNYPFPDRFVIKPIGGSGECTYLFNAGFDLFQRKKISLEEVLNSVHKFFSTRQGSRFIVEELLIQKGGEMNAIPLDYKFHVFGGKVRIVHVDDRNVFASRDHLYRQSGYFAKNWIPTPFPFRNNKYVEESIDFSKPHNLSEMTAIAESIGAECRDYVRVDLYDAEGGIALGEVTTFSHSGLGFTEYGNRIMAQLWHISVLTSKFPGFMDWTEK